MMWVAGVTWPASAAAQNFIVYIGSYTDAPSTSKGIYAARFDSGSGRLTPIGPVVQTTNPAFLTGTPDGRFVYAVNWQTPAVAQGGLDTVSAFAVDRRTGALTTLDKVSAGGALPNQALVDPSGEVLVVANYGAHAVSPHNAGIAAMRIGPDGKLAEPFYIDIHPNEPISAHQTSAHTHGIAFDKGNRHVFIADLGLDRIYTYDFDAHKPLLAHASPAFIHVPPGSGPRRLVVSSNGNFLYCNYQDSSKVGVFQIESGHLKKIQEISTLPDGYKGRNATAEIAIDHAGRHLYVSNRGADTVAVYGIDGASGTLTHLEDVSSLGKSPRNITFDPTGTFLFVANQASNNLVVFRQDRKTGHLTPVGQTMNVPQVANVFFVKAE